jgi:hypothetical protein
MTRARRPRQRQAPPPSDILVKLIAGDDYRAGVRTGGLPSDAIDFLYLDTHDRRRERYDAALPQVQTYCRRRGWDVPEFAEVLKAHGIPEPLPPSQKFPTIDGGRK